MKRSINFAPRHSVKHDRVSFLLFRNHYPLDPLSKDLCHYKQIPAGMRNSRDNYDIGDWGEERKPAEKVWIR